MKQLIVVLCALLIGVIAKADKVLVLSGGGTPAGNHYSQYLQTKTLSDNLRAAMPGVDIETYFAAGNAPTRSPVLADVHRQVNTISSERDVMMVGEIEGNKSATHANVDAYFTQDKMKSMAPEETLFILVSDHGMPNRDSKGESDQTFSDNCLDLWSFTADVRSEQVTTLDWAARCFSKGELRKHLDQDVSAGRVVFAMSQCFSGGFHRMSVDDQKAYPTANPRICGFAAVTEDTTASGCTADVDGPAYQGYERSFTEQLTGVDVVTGKKLRPRRPSLMEAHRAAALEDMAKDIPLATSDFYLWKWAQKIENSSFIPRSGSVTSEVARQTLMETRLGDSDVGDRDLLSKEGFFTAMKRRFEGMYPEIAYAFNGNIATHQRLLSDMDAEMTSYRDNLDRMSRDTELRLSAVLGEWNKYVRSAKSTLSQEERDFEFQLFGNGSIESPDQAAIFLMSMRTLSNPESAELLSQYKSMRQTYALNWAMGSGNAALSEFAQKVKRDAEELSKHYDRWDEMEKRFGHVRRLLIYREALGAWKALAKMDDQAALKDVHDLIACESASLPR